MLVLFLIFFLHTSIQAENDETKLIDLLPEKEKEQFLNQIARRILEEVQSNENSPKASGELSDAQLNQHDAYVQKVLKEESQNLRKKLDDTAITDSATNVTSNKKENVRSDDGYVDLTLRSDHRSKRDNNSKVYTEHANKNVSDNESESEVDIQVKNFRRSRETAEKPDYDDTVTINHNANISDENKQYTEKLVDNFDIATQNSIVENNSTLLLEPYDNDEKSNNTAVKNNKSSNNSTNNLQEITLKSSQNNSKVNKNDSSTHNEDNLTVSTAPQIGSKYVLKSDNKLYPKDKNKGSDLQTTKIVKSVAETVILTTLPPILKKLHTSKVKNRETIKPNVDGEIFIAPEYVNSFNKVNKIKDSTHKNNMDLKLLPTKDPIQKALRQKPQEKIYEKQDVNSKDLKARYEMNNLKAYEVYEISPGANPFVKRDTIKVKPQITNKPFMNEQPHYAPIYNYKPQNAFFDGRNLYGLNTYSEKEEDIYKTEENSHENNENMNTNDYYNDIYNNNKGKNSNKDIYTLIYNHSPSNAFYNADNIYGRNDDSERIDYSVSNGANVDNFFIENDDKDDLILNDHDYDEKRNNIQWDYYFYNDPYRALGLNKKAERNLDWTQVRMGIKNNKKYCGNRLCDEYNDFTTESPKCVEPDELLYSTNRNHSNPPYLGDSVRHIRQLLLEQKAFSFLKPAEDHHALSDELEEQEAKDLSFLRDTHFRPKDPHRTNRDGNNSKKKNLNQKRVNKIGNETEYSFTKKILDMVPSGKDLVVILKQVTDLLAKDKMKMQRSNNFDDIDVIATVLEDMIYQNNKALVQYAWLETAVDFQSALKKMFDLVAAFEKKEVIHPSDLELLKYLVYLHSSAKEDILYNRLSEVRSMLPKSRKKKIITESGLLQRNWLKRMLSSESEIPRGDLASFEEFLGDLQTAVFDLHIALKYIAMVTKYNNQRWFQNLKELYIDPKRKQIIQIMIHLWATRILGLVQESAKNGLEDDYWTYVNKNEKEVNRTKQELVFVLRLLDEIKRS